VIVSLLTGSSMTGFILGVATNEVTDAKKMGMERTVKTPTDS